MKKVLLLLLLAIAGLGHARADDSTRVLFIGNSLTYFNDMPQMMRGIALNKGKKVSVSMYAPGGTGFMNHVQDNNVYELFRRGDWDVVVLQPGTSESAGASASVAETITNGQVLVDSIRQHSSCARIYLYEISNGIASATTYNNYFLIQKRILDSVRAIADGLSLPMVPAGECIRAYYTLHQNIFLHNSYGDVHPNANGSFMIASAFYTAIFQDSVKNCTYYGGINADSARKFFTIVDTVVLPHLPDWRINTYNLHADFNYLVAAGNTVNFTSTATNATQVSWNFGDNSAVVNGANPTHSYTAAGTYTVTQKVQDQKGCTDSMQKQVIISGSTAIHAADQDQLSVPVFPNPFADAFCIRQEQHTFIRYALYSADGRQWASAKIMSLSQQVDMSQAPDGVYILKLWDSKGTGHYMRLVKNGR